MDTLSKFYTLGVIFGKPYNGILFSIHKLIVLAGVIVTARQVYILLKTSERHILLIVLIVVAVVCVVALFATGAFLSIGNLNYGVVKLIHNIAPVIATLFMGLIIYILAGRNL